MPIIKKLTNDLVREAIAVQGYLNNIYQPRQYKTMAQCLLASIQSSSIMRSVGHYVIYDIIYNKNNPKYIIKVIEHIRLCVQRQGRK